MYKSTSEVRSWKATCKLDISSFASLYYERALEQYM